MARSSHHLGEASMDMAGVLEASEKGSTSAEGGRGHGRLPAEAPRVASKSKRKGYPVDQGL